MTLIIDSGKSAGTLIIMKQTHNNHCDACGLLCPLSEAYDTFT